MAHDADAMIVLIGQSMDGGDGCEVRCAAERPRRLGGSGDCGGARGEDSHLSSAGGIGGYAAAGKIARTFTPASAKTRSRSAINAGKASDKAGESGRD